MDALGRDIAVADDNGAAPTPTFRVTTYTVATGAFTGTTYDLTLAQNLTSNYFVMLHGVVDSASPDAASSGARVTHDPNGTGDLGTSSGANVIRLSRALASGDWVGTVVVWECLGDSAASGFTLLDVKSISAASTSSGTEQITTATGTAWSTLPGGAVWRRTRRRRDHRRHHRGRPPCPVRAAHGVRREHAGALPVAAVRHAVRRAVHRLRGVAPARWTPSKPQESETPLPTDKDGTFSTRTAGFYGT